MKFLAFVFILFSSLFVRAENLYRFETTFQNAGNYHGSIFGLSSDVPVSDTLKLLPRAENLTRTFDGGPSFNETTLTMDAAQKLSASTYVIGGVSATPNAVLNSNWTARLDPHYASGKSDLGFRMAYADYSTEQAAIFTPSYLYSFTDDLMVSESVACVRADNWYVSSATQLIAKPIRHALIRVSPAFGQTLESAGAPAAFTAFSLEASYDIHRHVRVGIGGTNYNSTLRSEKSILLRLEAW